MLPVVVARSSSDENSICYVLPVLWMTSYLPVIGEAKATLYRTCTKMTHKGAAPGAKCDMSAIALFAETLYLPRHDIDTT